MNLWYLTLYYLLFRIPGLIAGAVAIVASIIGITIHHIAQAVVEFFKDDMQ